MRSIIKTAAALAALSCAASLAAAQTLRASCDNRQGRSFADVIDSSDPNESGYNVDPSEIYRSFNSVSFPNSQTSGSSSASANLLVNSRFVGTNPGAKSAGFILNNSCTASATRGTQNVLALANDTSAVCFDVGGVSAASPLRMRVKGSITTSGGATGRIRLENPSNGSIVNITLGSIDRVISLAAPGTYRFTATLDTGSVQPASGTQSRSVSVAAALVCMADVNASGTITSQDIFDFLALYFSGNLGADANASGALSVQDIFDFLAQYFQGCDF